MKQYECTICNKTFSTRQVVENHIEGVHFPGMFEYKCKYCGVSIDTRKKLYHHQNKLHGKGSWNVYPPNLDILPVDGVNLHDIINFKRTLYKYPERRDYYSTSQFWIFRHTVIETCFKMLNSSDHEKLWCYSCYKFSKFFDCFKFFSWSSNFNLISIRYIVNPLALPDDGVNLHEKIIV